MFVCLFVAAVQCDVIKKLPIAAVVIFSIANCSYAKGDGNLSVHLSE